MGMKRKAWEDILSDTMYPIYIKSEMHLVKLREGVVLPRPCCITCHLSASSVCSNQECAGYFEPISIINL